jgi:GNAT superfamily N-acetyltransferase
MSGESLSPPQAGWPALVEHNLVSYFQHAARSQPLGKLEQTGGLLIAAANTRFYMFNAAFLSTPVWDPDAELLTRIQQAARHLENAGQGWSFWVCDDKCPGASPRQIESAFRRCGLVPAYRHAGMAATELKPSSRTPVALDVRPVSTRETRAAFSHINAAAFGLPFEWCLDLYGRQEIWRDGMYGWVGYRNQTAIATAAILMTGPVAGLYSVATLPEFQREGVGETMVRFAANYAWRELGAQLLVLQSTREGRRLYDRLGCRVVTHFSVFAT